MLCRNTKSMRFSRLALLPVVVLSLSGFRPDDSYTLKQKYAKDQVETYQASFTVSAEGAEFEASMKNRYKVLSVESDGAYEIEETTLEGNLKMNGEEQAMEKSEPKVRKYDKDGKEVKKDGEEEDNDPVSDLVDEVFDFEPDHAVKVGDSWDLDTTYGTIHATLESKEKVGEVDCLKVTIKGTLTKKDSAGDVTGTFFVRASDFSPEKMEAKVDNPKLSADEQLKKIEIKMNRIAD